MPELNLQLHRVTSEYIQNEDRFRLTGEDQMGNALCLWLTQRLALRVVSHLVTDIATHSPEAIQNPSQDDDANKLLQGNAQQAAQEGLSPQEAVASTSTTRALLIQEVDMNRAPDGAVGFVFKDGPEPTAQKIALGFQPQQLRQWLIILYSQWLLSEWPVTVWPEWITGQEAAPAPENNNPVH
jgi:hypothetical protein